MEKILIVDDELNMRLVLSAVLKKEGFEVSSASNGLEAMQILKSNEIDLVITDLKMPDIDGMELLTHISVQYPGVPVIMITAHGSIANAVEALKKGAFDYITKPFELDDLKNVVSKAVKTRTLKEGELALTPEEIERISIIGTSKKKSEIFDAVKRVSQIATPVMITGENGTGKELVADAIHYNSSRKNNPLIKISCAAIDETLMEQELFGYRGGAFSDAAATKPGKFELADTGTLFLDEVAEIPCNMQAKLLRAIQKQEFERVGGLRTIKVNVRIIAATGQNLKHQVREGKFLEDLFHCLNVSSVDIPPLRERREDILPLADYFLDKFNRKLQLSVKMEEEVKEMLSRYDWPGNIRELEDVVKKMMLTAKNNLITFREMPYEFKLSFEERAKPFKEYMRGHMENVERQMIIKCLEESGGNVTGAAKQLGMSRKGLQLKMIKYSLRKEVTNL